MATQQTPQLIKDYAWYTDGVGKIGLTPKIKLPDLEMLTEDYLAGGMAGAIELDFALVEKLMSTVTLAEPDPQIFRQFGLMNGENLTHVFRSALQGRGEVVAFKITMVGRCKKIAFDEIERKKLSNIDIEITCVGLKIEHGTEVLVDIDLVGGNLVTGGVDRRAGINAALGI